MNGRLVADDDDYDVPTPPFDAFYDLPVGLSLAENERKAREIDSAVRDALEPAVNRGRMSYEDMESIDRYFKGVWMKHHG